MKKLTILVDIDGVVADTLPMWLAYIYQKTGVLATMDDITEWNLARCGPLTQVDPATIYDILNEPDFTTNIQPFPGASEKLEKLHDAGHNIYFVTARHGAVCMPETLTWLRRHFPWVDTKKQLSFIYDKHLMKGDVFIDDSTGNLALYREHHPTADLITIDYSYNQQDIDGIYRVPYADETWDLIYTHINHLAQVINENIH